VTVYYATILAIALCGLAADSLRRRAREVDEVAGRALVRQSSTWAVLAGMVLTAVGMFRWRVGADYGTYAALYPAFAAEQWRDFTIIGEPGIRVIAKVGAWIHDDYATMFAACAIVITALSTWTISRRSRSLTISLLLFVLTGPWLGSFNGIRQYLAAAVVFAAYPHIVERRFLRYLLAVLVAGLFHVSAFLLILLYFLPRRRISFMTSVIVLGSALAATNLYDSFLQVVVVFREDAEFGGTNAYFAEEVSPLRIAAALAPLLFFVLVSSKGNLTAEDHFFTHMTLLNAAVLLAASGSAYIARFAIYIGIFLCLALPRFLELADRRWQGVFLMMIMPAYAVFWYVDTVQSPTLVEFQWLSERVAGQ
jgi:transmembrane protein EpsG